MHPVETSEISECFRNVRKFWSHYSLWEVSPKATFQTISSSKSTNVTSISEKLILRSLYTSEWLLSWDIYTINFPYKVNWKNRKCVHFVLAKPLLWLMRDQKILTTIHKLAQTSSNSDKDWYTSDRDWYKSDKTDPILTFVVSGQIVRTFM